MLKHKLISKTVVSIYKDYLTHIIPQKSLNSWLLDKDWNETNKELLCVGLDYKPLNSMSMSKKDFDYKLKECGSKNFSVFLNLPSSYEGDDLLNDKNKRSSLLLMGKKAIPGPHLTLMGL